MTELRELKQTLNALITNVSSFLRALDAEMREPASQDRGQRVALLANNLDIANDAAMRFGLGLDWDQIKLRKNGQTK